MTSKILKGIFSFLRSDFTKKVIIIGVDALIKNKTGGIDSELAKTLIDGIVESKQNPINKNNVTNALHKLKS